MIKLVLALSMIIMSTSALNNKGMTWRVGRNLPNLNVVQVGCNGCDAYTGDTSCSVSLPILCVSKTDFNRPPYDPLDCNGCAMSNSFYYSWSGGYIAITPVSIQGSAIGSQANADRICQKYLGPEFIAIHHHLGSYVSGMSSTKYFFDTWPTASSGLRQGGGWNTTGYGQISNTGRFWAFISNQPSNCWN